MENNQNPHRKMTEGQKESVMERLWLNYYNEALYAKGAITEEERNKMKVQIIKRSHSMER